MLVEEISSFDSSFKLIQLNSKDLVISGISDKRSLKKNNLYFCSHIKFWKVLKESSNREVFVIFDEKTLGKLEKENEDFEFLAGWGVVENISLAISFLSKPFYEDSQKENNDAVDGRKLGSCQIHPSAIIAENVFIGANVVIEKDVVLHANSSILSNSSVGEGTVIFPNVSIMPKTTIGRGCRIHSGTVIGADGFGYNFDKGIHHKVWHTGGVSIGEDVEIGSNCSIDQGTFSPTVIESGTKIDNLVQVAHNVVLKKGVVLCGQVGIAGSATIGDYTVAGGSACIAPDMEIGSACQIGGMAGVISSLEDKSVVAGFPARPVKEWLKGIAYLRKKALNK